MQFHCVAHAFMVALFVAVVAVPVNATQELHMVSNKGYKLAFYVTPGCLPALILDAGGGNDASYWDPLVPVLANKTNGLMIVTYDRAGMGRSDEVPGAWKPQNAVSDLKAGLRAIGLTRNVILVSHSQAGEIATYLARSAKWVAAGVLVDASLPNLYTDSVVAKLVKALEEMVEEIKKKPSTKATRQLIALAADYGPVHRAYHKIAWPKRIPATAIVSSETPFPTDPAGAQLWRDAQAEFVSAARDHRWLMVAANSSHHVPIDRPDVIVKAVEDILKKVKVPRISFARVDFHENKFQVFKNRNRFHGLSYDVYTCM